MEFLKKLGISKSNFGASTGQKWLQTKSEGELKIHSPVDGKYIASVHQGSEKDYEKIIKSMEEAFLIWREVPAPARGEIVRQIGLKLREYKEPLGQLVSYEMGKSLQEGLGEVQEMIDICDFAVGQSRQLYGFTMQSERPMHRMYDQYHPLGIVCTISAFNFPVAVYSWNAMLAAVCGDVNIWKPSSKVPLSAIATQNIIAKVLKENNLPEGIFTLIVGKGSTVGERILNDKRVAMVSVTGSTRVGKHAAEVVSGRFGKTILELGGNNAIIITPDADLKIAIPAVVFGAVGTAGQRCTSTRRLIIHDSIYNKVKESLVKAYKSIRIGDPLNQQNHMGPLIDKNAVNDFSNALKRVKKEGGKIIFGGEVLSGKGYESGCYVSPAIAEAQNHFEIVQEETFAPILYIMKYKKDVNEAIALQNGVVQGLSSSIFTNNMREAEQFLSASGSDCGIANVNIGTSGAEIGGAFGGEKETGGGRESGSDSWKAYMRRQTNTINFGSKLPLAQGIKFDI
ncbi:MAG: aldehyde dehydrogenase family protein [Ignavibacteriota bacterium]|jgi:aldehyde dehydrogenase (NAD+)|nr:MAG: aldehyde dehydrogenase family protein [Chlorobiota bacterium]MBE7477912.1 aldehyde dehydrogenase family protein [Ignavibacteriales bacterium]MBL1123558.1 aldehyde dehydrogenase family protein [Ignavibacteriota bacterium]MCC7094119.1 aldehyde dehydrogenase family protein [Ignavibacteriaceae bacterium]MCE7856996.1 aldehyde dehydrogenase family protein [Ignavibacteria bacterium CHB3]MEB2296709.1 aldehyde dehydrogenase family protein [Ignavibacteria bacterium]